MKLLALFAAGAGGSLALIIPSEQMMLLIARGFAVLGALAGVVALAWLLRTAIDWVAAAAGYPFPDKDDSRR